jgi:hypothetical protein
MELTKIVHKNRAVSMTCINNMLTLLWSHITPGITKSFYPGLTEKSAIRNSAMCGEGKQIMKCCSTSNLIIFSRCLQIFCVPTSSVSINASYWSTLWSERCKVKL